MTRPRPRCLFPRCENLETRTLLSTTPGPYAPTLTTGFGDIARPGEVGSVDLPITPGRYTPPASGRILFQIVVQPTTGDSFIPGGARIVAPSGEVVARSTTQLGHTVVFFAFLAPSDYAIQVRGRGRSIGSFLVTAQMVGDVNGNHSVSSGDLQAITGALGVRAGQPGYSPALDLNRSGGIGPIDVRLATRNLGATSSWTMKFQINDNTAGAYAPNQIYVAILGLDSSGHFAHLDRSGNLVPMSLADNTLLNPSNGQKYADYFIPLSELPTGITVPNMTSGRVYIGMGSPLWIKVNTDVNGKIGYAGPDLNNPTDPNVNVYFDTIEFTTDGAGFHGNTTQVDQFGVPMVMTLASTNGAAQTVGITEKRDAIFNAYRAEVPASFQAVALSQAPFRILAPKHADYSQSRNPTYFDAVINQFWTQYTTQDLVVTVPQGQFTGRVVNNAFEFRRAGDSAVYRVFRPQSWEVFASAGVMASGNEIEKALAARIDAAFNRNVEFDPEFFLNQDTFPPSKYYAAPPANFYAAFWHRHSIGGLAYGFDFDDVGNQSSSLVSANPQQLTLSLTWN